MLDQQQHSSVIQETRNLEQAKGYSQLGDRPALLLLLVQVLMILAYNYFLGYQEEFQFWHIMLVAGTLPAILLENRWIGSVQSGKMQSSSYFNVIRGHRLVFLASSFVFSFLLIITSLLYKEIFVIEVYSPSFNLVLDRFTQFSYETYHISAIAFASVFSALLVAASFYRIRTEQAETGERYNLISTPSQIKLLMAYAMAGLYMHIWVMWAAQYVVDQTLGYNATTIETISANSASYYFLVIAAFFIFIPIAASEIPKYIVQARYRIPSREELAKLLLKSVIVIMVISILIDMRLSTRSEETMDSLSYVFIIGVPVVYYFLSLDNLSTRVCPQCNLITNGECSNCNLADEQKLPFSLTRAKKFEHPKCSNCGRLWEKFERKCSCGFQIVLACEYCGNVLNPLWKNCYNCGRERPTIPELALKAPGSASYVRSQSYLRILVALLIVGILFQLTSILYVLANIAATLLPPYYQILLYATYSRILIFAMTIIAIIIIIVISSIEHKKGLGLVANRVALAPGITLMNLAIINLVIVGFRKVITGWRVSIIGDLLFFLFALGLLAVMLYNNYNSLISFRPVIPFNPNWARNGTTDLSGRNAP